ncbi:MAG: hypothetical protein ACK5PQ_02485 [Alphaproteobacteria bacterium]
MPHFSWDDYHVDGILTVDGLHPFQEQGILRSQGLRYIINPGMDMEKWFQDENRAKILKELVPLLWEGGTLEKKPYQDMKRKMEGLTGAGDEPQQAFVNVRLAVMLRKREREIRVEMAGWEYDGAKTCLL